MLGFIILFFKRIGLLLSGVPARTAWYFATWRGGGNIGLLKQFRKNGNKLIHIPTQSVLPIAWLHCFNCDVNLLARVCSHYMPKATNSGLELHANPNGRYVKSLVSTYQTLFVFDEVFGREIYGCWMPSDCIVVDVGMNVGMASLYFSSFPFVKRVYGFELMRNTYQLALENFQLNPGLKSKICAKPVGIGLHDNYYLNNGNAAGATDTSIDLLSPYLGKVEMVESKIEVQSAVDVLGKLLEQNKEYKMILKLDCEGLEYELLQMLADSGVLKQIMVIMVEWHQRGALPLLNVFSSAGFSCQYRPDEYFDGRLGMIYAFNSVFYNSKENS